MRAYGYRNASDRYDLNTMFRWGSVSKTLVFFRVLQLLSNSKTNGFNIDDSIHKYMSEKQYPIYKKVVWHGSSEASSNTGSCGDGYFFTAKVKLDKEWNNIKDIEHYLDFTDIFHTLQYHHLAGTHQYNIEKPYLSSLVDVEDQEAYRGLLENVEIYEYNFVFTFYDVIYAIFWSYYFYVTYELF